MRRIALVCFTLCALTFGLTNSVAAQDRDCPDFNGDGDAAQAYFEANGGSASNNFDGLDRDHDGTACDNLAHSGSTGDTGTDVTSPDSDDSDSGDAEALPSTGSGPASDADASATAILGASAVLLAGAAMFIRRGSFGRF